MSQLRDLPRVDAIAADPLLSEFSEPVRVRAARTAIEGIRRDLLDGKDFDMADAPKLAFKLAKKMSCPSLRQAINLTGVVLHTGLGRARLAKSVVDQMASVLASHCLVELDVETGKRGSRQDHVKGMLKELTGAEDILVVNNCASSVLLTLMCLCSGKEVILSRGEMIEIGGSFRMPDIVKQSGCQLVEVGCTNKTHLRDYEEAITENTGAILHCHQSNYKMVGFVLRQTLSDLAELGRKRDVMIIEDIGAGCLLDTSLFGLPKEETLQEAVACGPDVILSSGDKLLGGPQCGILLGEASVIAKIKKHPLARALRVDKLTMTALEGTLRLYMEGRERELPVWKYISASMEGVKAKAEEIQRAYKGKCTVEEGITEIGGGSLPGSGIPTWRVGFPTDSPEDLLKKFRKCEPPLIGRIENDHVWLDPRTLEDDELPFVLNALENLDRRE